MKSRRGDGVLELAPGQSLIVSNGPGITVKCMRGRLWLTQHNDRRDVVLGRGETFTLDRDGDAVLSAEEASALVLVRPPSRHAQSLRHLACTLGIMRTACRESR